MKTTVLLAALAAAAALTAGSTAAAEITYPDLVKRLIDLKGLAVLPEPETRAGLSSSYCRRSQYNSTKDEYENWDCGADWADWGAPNYVDPAQGLMADIQGPGVIWRMWTASWESDFAVSNKVAILFGPNLQTVVNMPWYQYFDRSREPFTDRMLTPQLGGSGNIYVPIPFNQSCRIKVDDNPANVSNKFYYQINHSTFPAGTQLPSFSTNLSAQDRQALRNVNAFLQDSLGQSPHGFQANRATDERDVQIGGGVGAVSTVLKIPGPRAITGIRVNLPLSGDFDQDRILLRELSIRIFWDNEAHASVWAPLSDFFGTTNRNCKSLPVGKDNSGFYCFWYMPFAQSATVQLLNDGHQARTVHFSVTHSSLDLPIDRLGRFHAKWHRDAFDINRTDRQYDWRLLATQGRGRFVGTHLSAYPPSGWPWIEGDETFYVDGEKFPSNFGTGLEDYFNQAWGFDSFYEGAFATQTAADRTYAISRWHIPDNFPFQTGFDAFLEKLTSDSRFSATAYWYLNSGGSDPYVDIVPVQDRVSPFYNDNYAPAAPTNWVDPYRNDPPVRVERMRGSVSTAHSADETLQVFDFVGRARGIHRLSALEPDALPAGVYLTNRGRVLFTQKTLSKGHSPKLTGR